MARKRGTSWQGFLKTPTKYYRYNFPTQSQAEEWENKARLALEAGLAIPLPNTIAKVRPTFAKLYEAHGRDIWNDFDSVKCRSEWKMMLSGLPADLLPNDLDESHLIKARAKWKRDGAKPTTINGRFSRLSKLLKYAKKLKEIDSVPEFPREKLTEEQERLRFLTVTEETKLLALLDHWGQGDICEVSKVLIDTGCRPGEIVQSFSRGAPIKWSEVSESAGGTAPDVQGRAVIHIKRTKTARMRTLPLTDRARAAFLWSHDMGHSRPFDGITSETLWRAIRRAADHLGMEDVVPYTFRHTCASRLVQRGADLRRVKDWMGHTSIQMTLKYAKLTPSDIFDLADML